MPGYLLLRDNKESGPHSLEEMIAKQLKQHDLIWVEGRSAAWRYPEELEEFKNHITSVPDTASTAKSTERETLKTAPHLKKPIIQELQAFSQASNTQKNETPAPRERVAKYISVIFPSTAKQAPEKKQAEPPSIAAEKNPPVLKERIIVEEELTPSFSSGTFLSKVPKNNHPISDKKDRGFDTAKKLIWGVAILMGGIVLGLSLDNIFKTKPEIAKQASETAAQQTALPIPPKYEKPLNSGSVENNDALVSKVPEPERPQEIISKKKTAEKNLQPSENIITPTNSSPTNENVIATSAPAKKELVNEEKERVKANIGELITVNNNKFKVGGFGGISDLQISVSNNSHYSIDVVSVEVQYVLANKKTFKTETIYFRDLRPGVTLMQEAPKSSRGVKVLYSINNISSKELGL